MAIRHHHTERMRLQELLAAPYNPREDLQPGDRAYDALAASMERFGVVEPLVYNKRTNRLVGGHQRLKVLLADGATETDVVVVDLPESEEKALNIALNKITGEWDEDKLALLLDEILDNDAIDIEVTGFDFDEAEDIIDDILGGNDEDRDEDFDFDGQLDEVVEPVTQPGDLIQLGTDPETAHWLLCGDCTDVDGVSRLLRDERAVLMATDPPYFVGIDDEWDAPTDDHGLYERAFRIAAEHAIKPNAAIFVWHASRTQAVVEAALREAGVLIHNQIIWVKPTPVIGRSTYLWRHEPCFFGWQTGHRPKRYVREKLTTVWEIAGIRGSARPDHPTPKPLEIFEIPMRHYTKPGEICFEPFAGSGSQFIAAERLGRRCFGIELSPRYCDLIVRRFMAFAGHDAVPRDISVRYRLTGHVAQNGGRS